MLRSLFCSLLSITVTTGCVCGPAPSGPETDAGADSAVDSGTASDAASDSGWVPDGGGPPSPYENTQGDCVLVWLTSGVDEGTRISAPATFRDVDGDGRRDLLTSNSDYDCATGTTTTRILARRGGDGQTSFSFELEGSAFARGVDDLNGDGVEDILVRSSIAHTTSSGCGGPISVESFDSRLSAHSGLDGALLWERFEAGNPDANFAADAIQGPDLGGDGVGDILVSWPFLAGSSPTDPPARLLVLDGQTGAEIADLVGPADAPGFGQRLLGLGDLDGDDVVEIGVNVGRYPSPASSAIMMVSLGAVDTPVWTVVDQPEDFMSAGATLDANGDGALDVVATLRDRWLPGGAQGVVHVLDGLTGVELWRTDGTIGNGHFGVGMATVSDANGDGTADVAAGTAHSLPNIPTAGTPGQLAILSGTDGHFIAEVLHHVDSMTFSDFGSSIAAFDDPTERGGAGVLVVDGASDQGVLSAWSCLGD